MRLKSSIFIFRSLLKFALIIVFVMVISNSIYNYTSPTFGISTYKDYEVQFPSFTMCLQQNKAHKKSFSSFDEFMNESYSIKDLFNFTITFGDQNEYLKEFYVPTLF